MSRAWMHALVLVVGGCSCGDSRGFCADWSVDSAVKECETDLDCPGQQCSLFGKVCEDRIECEEDAECACDERCLADECRPSGAPCPEGPPECLQAGSLCADDAACCNARCLGFVCTDEVACSAGGDGCVANEDCCSALCDAGSCGAPKCALGAGPEVVVEADTLELAQSADRLYWLEAGEVRSIDKRGGVVTTLAVGGWGESIARFETTLAWSGLTDEIWTMADDAEPMLASQSPAPVWRLSANAQGVFWSVKGEGFQDAIHGAPAGNPDPPGLLAELEVEQGPHAIASDETHVYFSDGFAILRVAIVDGVAVGPVEPLRTGENDDGLGIDRLALDADRVYFLDAGAMQSVPKAGGDELVIASDVHGAYGIALDDEHVYWTANDGVVFSIAPYPILYRAPKVGGPAVALVGSGGESMLGARSVVVDEACAYWVDAHRGLVLKVAK